VVPHTSDENFFICKLDTNGNLLWVRTSNTIIGDISNIGMVVDDEDYIYVSGVLTGTIEFNGQSFNELANLWPGDAYIARYNTNGDLMGVVQLPYGDGLNLTYVEGNKPVLTGMFYVTTHTITIGSDVFTCTDMQGTPPENDMFIAKHDAITGIVEARFSSGNELIIYANPTEGKCTVEIPDSYQNESRLQLTIYSSLGKVIQQIPVEINQERIKINIEQEARGIYPVVLSNGKTSFRGKIVFE
jgi:hypothetical protein